MLFCLSHTGLEAAGVAQTWVVASGMGSQGFAPNHLTEQIIGLPDRPGHCCICRELFPLTTPFKFHVKVSTADSQPITISPKPYTLNPCRCSACTASPTTACRGRASGSSAAPGPASCFPTAASSPTRTAWTTTPRRAMVFADRQFRAQFCVLAYATARNCTGLICLVSGGCKCTGIFSARMLCQDASNRRLVRLRFPHRR